MAAEKVETFSGEEAKKKAEEMGEPLIQISVYKAEGDALGVFVDSVEEIANGLMRKVLSVLCEQFNMICLPKEMCVGIAVFEGDSDTETPPQ